MLKELPCDEWVDASFDGSLLCQNDAFSLGTFYSNAHDD
jgi:hypothetical protein